MSQVDVYVATGSAIDHIGRMLLARPDLSIRVQDGRIELFSGNEHLLTLGNTGLELMVADWHLLIEALTKAPRV